ncbi:MAG: class I SAM-dependent methyltransferase [Phycisphaerae bacterium]
MCTSAPYAIPVIVHATRQVKPRSILDVGVGFGKYGLLFREYLDVWDARELAQTKRDAWTMRIDGIEIYPEYLTPIHDFIYDKMHIGHALEIIDELGQYDLIFMGDVLEHFEKRAGELMINKMYEHADKCVLLTFPTNAPPREGFWGNKEEAHLSVWTRDDFRRYGRVGYTTIEDRADVVAIAKPPHQVPYLVACMAARRRSGWKGKLATALVRAVGPSAASTMVGRVLRRRIALRAE